jgi:cation diffusion facilitator family transporter
MLNRKQTSRIEQRTLKISILAVSAVVVGSIGWGLHIESDVVILNGIFSMLSLISGGLSLLAARLVARPEDSRFPFGYAHVEPLVLSANGLMVLVICVYAFVNGVEGVLKGGHEVSAMGVIAFGAVSGLLCLAMWAYGCRMARRTQSQILKDDAREWLVDFGFSLVTLLAFAVLLLLEEPWHSSWARYADPAMTSVMALLALPIPIAVLRRSMREVLLMNRAGDEVSQRLAAVLKELRAEYDIVSCTPHVVKTGRTYFVEVDIVVGPNFEAQTIAGQDRLRERIWQGIGKPLNEAWLSIAFTMDRRWV